MYINLYYVDIIIVYEHNPSLCAHNIGLCNIVLVSVILGQMAFHRRPITLCAQGPKILNMGLPCSRAQHHPHEPCCESMHLPRLWFASSGICCLLLNNRTVYKPCRLTCISLEEFQATRWS